MTDIELLKEIGSRLDDEMENVSANLEELKLLQEMMTQTINRLITVERLRADRITDIRRLMLAYAKTRLKDVENELAAYERE